ncbi:hypothetical protein J6590_037491 [Homalodisca vitripennis]|nr:hypothetical protein J6590_037491 [Homalodisca vitripennis]
MITAHSGLANNAIMAFIGIMDKNYIMAINVIMGNQCHHGESVSSGTTNSIMIISVIMDDEEDLASKVAALTAAVKDKTNVIAHRKGSKVEDQKDPDYGRRVPF